MIEKALQREYEKLLSEIQEKEREMIKQRNECFKLKEQAKKYEEEMANERYKKFDGLLFEIGLNPPFDNSQRIMLDNICKAKLSAIEDNIVRSVYLEGLGIRKIAGRYGFKSSFVLQKLAKAVKILEQYMKETNSNEEEQKTQFAVGTSIDELLPEFNKSALGVRVYNALKRMGFKTIEEVKNTSDEDLLKIRNMGTKALNELKQVLEKYNG